MERIIFEGFRCFRKKHDLRLAPLTLLVGENSTGKSSVLAAIKLAFDACRSGDSPDFNEEPFELGTWDTIAHYHGGQGKRVKELKIGCTIKPNGKPRSSSEKTITITTHFEEQNGHPKLIRWEACQGDIKIINEIEKQSGRFVYRIIIGENKSDFRLPFFPSAGKNIEPFLPIYIQLIQSQKGVNQPTLFDSTSSAKKEEIKSITPKQIDEVKQVLMEIGKFFTTAFRPNALAPIRTRPQRTYNPLRDRPSPEGEHTPVVMSRLAAENPEKWKEMITEILEFGEKSGLFHEIDVHHLGGARRKLTQAFTIEISTAEQQGQRTIVDVGYGVSQVLPILVDVVLEEHPQRMMLLQQPEVHLHPKAQAELGTFLSKLVSSKKRRFVVETHSDYFIDRVRMAVRDGVLKPSDVAIHYFSHEASEVSIEPIVLDNGGNIVNPPKGYRDFFLREELRLLGAEDVLDH